MINYQIISHIGSKLATKPSGSSQTGRPSSWHLGLDVAYVTLFEGGLTLKGGEDFFLWNSGESASLAEIGKR